MRFSWSIKYVKLSKRVSRVRGFDERKNWYLSATVYMLLKYQRFKRVSLNNHSNVQIHKSFRSCLDSSHFDNFLSVADLPRQRGARKFSSASFRERC